MRLPEEVISSPFIEDVKILMKTIKKIEEILINEIAVILSRDPAEILPETPLNELGVDSLSFVELLVFIEKKFQIQLMESGLTKDDFHTLQTIASTINNMMCS